MAKRLERGPLELRELVEHENSPVGEADLSGTRARAPSDERRHGGAVVRRAQWPRSDERAVGSEHARHRMDPRHLEGLRGREWRQDPGQPPGEHRLPGARWAGEEKIVAAGRGDLERAPTPLLTADVAEVEQRVLRRRVPVHLDVRLRITLAPQVGGSLGEMADRDRLDVGERCLRCGASRAEDPREPGTPRCLRERENASNRPQPSVERKLADGRMVGEPVAGDLAGGSQNRQCDR